ncbi:MAG TPA: hypothetical protein PKA64_21590 [Myxococcota bacterium]|nr:hypothetical protein [Myxococcota bacterium]
MRILRSIFANLRGGDGVLVIHDDDASAGITSTLRHVADLLSAAVVMDPDRGGPLAAAWGELLARHPGEVGSADDRDNATIADMDDLARHVFARDLIVPLHLSGAHEPAGFAGRLSNAFGHVWRAEAAWRASWWAGGSPWAVYEGEELMERLGGGQASPHLLLDDGTDWLLERASPQAPIAVVCLVDAADQVLTPDAEVWRVELAESWRQAIDRTRGRPVRFVSVLAMSRSAYARAVRADANSPISTVLSRHRCVQEI